MNGTQSRMNRRPRPRRMAASPSATSMTSGVIETPLTIIRPDRTMT